LPRLLSVNVGHLTPNADSRRRPTGIDKRPVDGPIEVRAPGDKLTGLGSGLVGYEIGDHRHHGGDGQAVYAYGREELDDWGRRLRPELPNGMFGENLTTTGVDVSDALIGEGWPMGNKGWLKTFMEVARSGAYLSVATPGTIHAGDEITVAHRPHHGVTSRLAFRALTLERVLLPRLLAAGDDLPDDLRDMAEAGKTYHLLSPRCCTRSAPGRAAEV
jgi:MOSC domain-containing protein YiiM